MWRGRHPEPALAVDRRYRAAHRIRGRAAAARGDGRRRPLLLAPTSCCRSTRTRSTGGTSTASFRACRIPSYEPGQALPRLERNGGTGVGPMIGVMVGGGFFLVHSRHHRGHRDSGLPGLHDPRPDHRGTQYCRAGQGACGGGLRAEAKLGGPDGPRDDLPGGKYVTEVRSAAAAS